MSPAAHAGAEIGVAVVTLGVSYFVYDPLAPNWEVEETPITPTRYRLALKMKRYHTGGAGESLGVFKRRAEKLGAERGFTRFDILEYSEGIESETLGARRVAHGTVELLDPVSRPPSTSADSWQQNPPASQSFPVSPSEHQETFLP